MTNAEVFKNYGSEQWVVEQNLEFFLQEYWDAIREKVGQPHSQMPVNLIGFTKEFMRKESYTETKYAEMSKMETLEKNEVVVEDCQVVKVNSDGEHWIPIAPNIPEEMEQLKEEAYGKKIDPWNTDD